MTDLTTDAEIAAFAWGAFRRGMGMPTHDVEIYCDDGRSLVFYFIDDDGRWQVRSVPLLDRVEPEGIDRRRLENLAKGLVE